MSQVSAIVIAAKNNNPTDDNFTSKIVCNNLQWFYSAMCGMKSYTQTILFFVALLAFSNPVLAADLFVSSSGSDSNAGTSNSPLRTVQKGIDKARPGDKILLAPGTYKQDFITKTNGTRDKPITITGSDKAIVIGAGRSRIAEVNHNYITLNGFTIDGLHGSSGSASGYRDKLIYAQGKGYRSGVVGLKVLNMRLTNAAGECVRLRYFAQNNEIAFNKILNCGVEDFKFDGGGKNGEGVYVGTAPEQLNDGKNPTTDRDDSRNNWIHHNIIDTQGNECVDIKEGASLTIVENNYCTGQLDPNSGGLEARGNSNIFRYNQVFGNRGAGVRLGGDTSSDGSDNDVYGNNIYDNASGGIKFQAKFQGQICENVMKNNVGGNAVGTFGSLFSPSVDCTN